MGSELVERRERLAAVISEVGEAPDLVRLLGEVDSALDRHDGGILGMCELCGEAVGDDFLAANPLTQYCLCCLTPEQQRALERDLDLAWRIQSGLLPMQDLTFAGWQTHYRYQPAGPVSGDYCDLVTRESDGGTLYFLLGDVSGKGVAASFLMAHLNALFRSLIDVGLAIPQMVERANRIFSESTISGHYATLVCGRATADGEVEICNAGHMPPLLIRGGTVETVDTTGLPVGVFDSSSYRAHRVRLSPGDTLFLYTDGLTEAPDRSRKEYGIEGLARVLEGSCDLEPAALAAACLDDLSSFQSGMHRVDDLTMMVVQRAM
ncbi:MAG: SpoIIE family protein phosphatase [Acidobacteriota bacterium]